MKEILSGVPCFKDMDSYEFVDGSDTGMMQCPRLPILDAWVAHADIPEVKIPVNVLLDTGNDITIIAPRVLTELEAEAEKRRAAGQVRRDVPIPFHEVRTIPHWGESEGGEIFRSVFPLTLFLTPEDNYSSEHGFILLQEKFFDVAEVWLGQDILNKLVVTFDGPEGKVTISDPDKS